MTAGEVRVDVVKKRLVRLRRSLDVVPPNSPMEEIIVFWVVEDVLTEERYRVSKTRLGRTLTEMEVLAWASV
jgi:hypothetical protein